MAKGVSPKKYRPRSKYFPWRSSTQLAGSCTREMWSSPSFPAAAPAPAPARFSFLPPSHRNMPRQTLPIISSVGRRRPSRWTARTPSPPQIFRSLRIPTFSVSAAADASGSSDSSDGAILLDVQGMMCDGCAASVKRILESQVPKMSFDGGSINYLPTCMQPEVSSASVSFQTATASVRAVPDARTGQQILDLAEKLINCLKTCGFESRFKEETTELEA